MSKFLRTIRFDASDDRVFGRSAAAGEWAVSGAFAFAEVEATALVGKARQEFANGLLGLGSFGRTTFATVGAARVEDLAEIELALAQHFIDAYGAPDMQRARLAARDEMAFISDLVADVPINTVFTVSRHHDDDGRICEEFRTISASASTPQGRLWTFEPDGTDETAAPARRVNADER